MKKALLILMVLLFAATNVWGADTKISGLTADATPTADDLMVTVNDPAGTPANRKATIAQVLGTMPTSLRLLTDPGGDRIAFWDDSASNLKWLVPNTGLSITGTNLNAVGIPGGDSDPVGQIQYEDGSDAFAAEDAFYYTAATDLLTIVNIAYSGYIASGADPADAGAIRLSNADALIWEADAAGNDITALTVDSSEQVVIGDADTTGIVLTTTGDTNIYDAVNNGDPTFSFGAAAAEALVITADLGAGDQLLDSIKIETKTSQAGADEGKITFAVDEVAIMVLDDGGIIPGSADGAALGAADAEFSDLYLAASAIIYGENDQSNTLTSSATGWTMNLDLTVTGDQIMMGGDPADTGNLRMGNAAVIAFEDGTEATITHVDDTGFLVNLEWEVDGTLDADGVVELGDGEDNFSVASDGIDIDTSGNVSNAGTVGCGAITTTGNLILDDNTTDSPTVTWRDEDENVGQIYKSDSGDFYIYNSEGNIRLSPDGITADYMLISATAGILEIDTGGSSALTLSADGGDISIRPDGDDDDYVRFSTASHVPWIQTVGDANLYIDVVNSAATSYLYVTNYTSGQKVVLQVGEEDTNAGTGNLALVSEQGATDYTVTIAPHGTMTQDVSYVLPPDDGDADELLKTDGSGNLSWTAAGAGIAGPGGGSTDHGIARWEGAGGDEIQDSGILIDDNNDMFFGDDDVINLGASFDGQIAHVSASSILKIYGAVAGTGLLIDMPDAAAGTTNTYVEISGTTPAHAAGDIDDIFLDISPTISQNTAAANYALIDLTFSSPTWGNAVTSNIRGIYFVPTIGDATAGTNAVNLIEVAAIAGDAQVTMEVLKIGAMTGTAATENAINIGAGWDAGITNASTLDQNEDVDIDFDNADEEMVISNSAEYGADGAQVMINNTDADVTAAMYLLRLRYTDDGQANADFMVCEDNNGDDQIALSDGGAITAQGTITGATLTDGTFSVNSGTVSAGTWEGTAIAVDKGGTGADLSDPDANRLIGWDDTDADIRYIIIGSGLTYTAATDTLSATGTTTFAGMTDTDFTGPAANDLAVYDGTNSWDDKSVGGDMTAAINGAAIDFTLGEDVVNATKLKDTNAPADEDIFTYEATGTTGEWHTPAELNLAVINAAANISGTWEIQDEITLVFGNDANITMVYDEDVDDQFLITTTTTGATAITDPLFEFLVPATPTANQQVFGVAKGTQSSNTALFTLDEDGDASFAGSITSAATGDSYLKLSNNTAIAGSSDYRFYFEGGIGKLYELNTERVIVAEGRASGGLILGDAGPDAAGEIGFDGTNSFAFYGANSEDLEINVGTAANTCTITSNTAVSNLDVQIATLTADAIVASGAISGNNVNPDTADGATLGTDALEWSDIYFADSSVVYFGDDQDVTITHVPDVGILLNNSLQIYDAVINANPVINVGSSAAEEGIFRAVYDDGAQTLDYLLISTKTADAGANEGRIIFQVDEADIFTVLDAGVTGATANTQTLGSAVVEWADLFLGDSAVIYGQNDQGNTITSSATGWTFNLDITVSGGNINTGAVALVVGDASTTSIQLLTDGTGDAEIALPNDSIGPAEIATDAVTMDSVDADGAFTSLTGAWATTGLLSGGVVTKTTAAAYTIGTTNAAEAYGGVIYVTGAAVITMPAVAAGMNFTIITIGAVAVSADPDDADKMYLDGVLLDDGDKATNTSTTGDSIVCTYYSADGWYCMSGSPDGDNWTDDS